MDPESHSQEASMPETQTNLGISTWLIPSRPESSTLKNTSSYLLSNNSVFWHMSENTQYRGTAHNIPCGRTHIEPASLSRDYPKASVISPFPCPRDIENVQYVFVGQFMDLEWKVITL